MLRERLNRALVDFAVRAIPSFVRFKAETEMLDDYLSSEEGMGSLVGFYLYSETNPLIEPLAMLHENGRFEIIEQECSA